MPNPFSCGISLTQVMFLNPHFVKFDGDTSSIANVYKMDEEVLGLVLKLARVDSNRNHFTLDDLAVLQCVSTSVRTKAHDILENTLCQEQVCSNTLVLLGYHNSKPMKKLRFRSTEGELPIHGEIMLRTFIQTKRFLASGISDQVIKDKFVNYINEFTSKTALKTFTPSHTWTNAMGKETILFLMTLVDNKTVEMRLLGCYYIFYFIMHHYNQKKRSLNGCVLNNANFRDIVIDKTNELRKDLRNTISMMPFGFIEKLLRILSYVNTRLMKIE